MSRRSKPFYHVTCRLGVKAFLDAVRREYSGS